VDGIILDYETALNVIKEVYEEKYSNNAKRAMEIAKEQSFFIKKIGVNSYRAMFNEPIGHPGPVGILSLETFDEAVKAYLKTQNE
jgi:hypothetical protein